MRSRLAAILALTLCSVPLFAQETGTSPPKPAPATKDNSPKSKGAKKAAKATQPAGPPAWIWASRPAVDGQKVYFRKQFTIRNGLSSARLFATCDNGLTVYIDGQEVLKSDTWQTPVFKELSPVLHADSPKGITPHVLTVEGRNSGAAGGLLVRLVLEYSRANVIETIVTDETWKVSTEPAADWKSREFEDKSWKAAVTVGKLGEGPWAVITDASLNSLAKLKEPVATDPKTMKVAKGFHVERLYSVPKNEQGSWVNLCVDPKGRLITCDQHGGLFRITPPPLGVSASDDGALPAGMKIEKIDVPLGEAQGLLWAFDSLYVSVNTGGKYASGLYRVRDTNGDDQLDKVELLRELKGGGEHGPHAVLLSPDGQSLHVVCGNGTKLTELSGSRVPLRWGEDHLLPRMPDGRGFMRDVLAPGGCIYKIDPEGKRWELVSNGFRNQFDAAFNRSGELFAYDADMEWDINTPWYRPTRVNHVISGAEFGWRNGAGKWPAYYPDSFGAVVNVGPGSPTGVTFGYGAKFPMKYQNALYICDWSYGKMYAVHMTPAGASYTGQLEEFVTGTPLPLTDVVINPHDGAMYFAIGGRRVKSGLYRVTYRGDEQISTDVGLTEDDSANVRRQRQKLESFHGRKDPEAVEAAWPFLGSDDRALRFAARVAIEHQDPKTWEARALAEANPQAALTALLALTRATAMDPFHRTPETPPADRALEAKIVAALEKIDWAGLTEQQRIELLRAYAVTFNRFGPAEQDARQRTIARFEPLFPTSSQALNAELGQMLVYLQAPGAAKKLGKALAMAPSQEEQIEYARSLRELRVGWTPELREQYFQWFVKAGSYRGGASFGLFVQGIKNDAVAKLSPDEKAALRKLIDTKPETGPIAAAKPRPFVREWKMDELVAATSGGLKDRDFERGRTLFGAANCFACHRFDNQGGAVGPDLSSAAGRFSQRDLLESIVDPSKVISDQYAAVTVVTADGRVVTGRIVNLAGDSIKINTNMLDPNEQVNVDAKQVEEMFPAKLSMMPVGLLNTLNQDEVLDLMAYLLSRGDRANAMFKK